MRIHLDHARCSVLPEAALRAIVDTLERTANGSAAGLEACVDAARHALAGLIGATPDEIALTQSASHAANVVINGIAWRQADNVIVTDLCYRSIAHALLRLRDERGVAVRVVPTEGWRVSPEAVLDRIDARTRLVMVEHAPVWCGVVQPVEAIGAALAGSGVLFAVNATQSAGQLPLDVRDLHCAFLFGTSRKWLRGPRGLGFLYVRRDVIPALRPAIVGYPAARWAGTDALTITDGFVMLSMLASAIGRNAAAQTSTTPAALSADLSRHYFKTPKEEVEARTELNASLDHMARFQGQVNSAEHLLGLLHSYDAEQKLFAKHEAYLHLRCALGRKDAACHDRQELISNDDARTAFLKPEILAIPEGQLRRFVDEEPALAKYRYALSDIRRDAPHLLSASEQGLLDQFQPQIADWQYDLYDQVTADTVFGTVQTPAGSFSVARQRNLIAASPDARVRDAGFKKRYAGFASLRGLIAFALVNTVRAQTLLAKAHHYSDAPSRKYDNLYFDPKATRDLLARMAQHGDVVKRYEHIRSQDFERAYHQPAHEWDLSAPEPGFTPPTTALPEARSVFHAAFAGLGQEYQAAFDALLDPCTGRADIRPGGAANRYTSGFSTGFPGTTGMLFYGRYDGTFKDLSVIAHEGGHATHRQLMNENGVLPDYAHGPNFMFESFAEFNELVLADFMARHAADPTLQRYYREEWMDIKGLDAFYGAQDAVLEQGVYDGISAGTIRNADDLDTLSVKINDQFSMFPASTPETRTRWAMVDLMYEDPLYDVNYMYAGLLALKYYQLYSTRPGWFVPRYIALLKNGFTEPPADLLKQFLEVDLSGPGLLHDDLDLLNRRLDELETNAAK